MQSQDLVKNRILRQLSADELKSVQPWLTPVELRSNGQLFPAHARGSVAKDVHSGPSAWPVSGGEMGARIRAFDWERSPRGPISSWSHSLKGTVELMMASQLAMNLVWGPESGARKIERGTGRGRATKRR